MPKVVLRLAGAALLASLPAFVPPAPAQERSMAELFVPPPCTPPGPFNDVPHQDPFCPWIQQLVADQITSGCVPEGLSNRPPAGPGPVRSEP